MSQRRYWLDKLIVIDKELDEFEHTYKPHVYICTPSGIRAVVDNNRDDIIIFDDKAYLEYI